MCEEGQEEAVELKTGGLNKGLYIKLGQVAPLPDFCIARPEPRPSRQKEGN